MHIINRNDPSQPDGRPLDEIQGKAYGTGISIIFEDTDVVGSGPRLHQHPYPETFILHAGRVEFTVGDRQLVAEAGQVIVVPPYTPHKFSVLGPDRYVATHIHENEVFITEWLED